YNMVLEKKNLKLLTIRLALYRMKLFSGLFLAYLNSLPHKKKICLSDTGGSL
ncbi:hypothetical protein ACJX0J_032128, partial [Zea mays]